MATNSQIKAARPRLFRVAPLTAVICWGYAAVNMFLGSGMFFIYRGTVAPISVASVLSYQQWGVIFFVLGFSTLLGLLTNNWKVTRRTQLAGLLVKAIWTIALIVRCITAPQTILITGVWVFFAFIQGAVYLFFAPKQALRDEYGRD